MSPSYDKHDREYYGSDVRLGDLGNILALEVDTFRTGATLSPLQLPLQVLYSAATSAAGVGTATFNSFGDAFSTLFGGGAAPAAAGGAMPLINGILPGGCLPDLGLGPGTGLPGPASAPSSMPGAGGCFPGGVAALGAPPSPASVSVPEGAASGAGTDGVVVTIYAGNPSAAADAVLAEIKAANDKALAEAREKERQEAERAAAEKSEADRLAAEQANLNDLEGDLDVPEKTQAELNQFYQDKIDQIDKQLENENLSTKARQQLLDEREGWKSEINDPSKVVLNGDIPLDEEEIAEVEQQKRDSLRDEQAESAKNDFGKADYLERHGNRLARQAELAHIIGDDETEERLRKESQRLKLEAATIRDGERGSITEQKQIEAGNLMRSFLDLADKGADGLPRQVKEFYDWAKIPIRDGLPQITEEVVDLEQRFHQWLKERYFRSGGGDTGK